MRIAILTANLGNFDTNTASPVEQELPEGVTEVAFHRFTDEDFPPITGLTPRFQYRIPKLFGWQMFPGYDIYIWMDGGMNLERSDSVKWFMEQLGDADAAFFQHPWRKTVKEEVDHIEQKLQEGNKYITSRYKNGLHKEFLVQPQTDEDFKDEHLYASTVFIYKASEDAIDLLQDWWYLQSRYFTCDQVQLPLAIYQSGAIVNTIPDNLFKSKYISLVSKHK